MKKNRLYLLLITACLAGYIYTAFSYHKSTENDKAVTGVCLVKHTMHIPCPSCGSTRSVISLLNGDIPAALYWNPFGLILFVGMLVVPFWILFDVLKHSSSFYIFYSRTEFFMRRKWIFIPGLILVGINWIWNIYKDL